MNAKPPRTTEALGCAIINFYFIPAPMETETVNKYPKNWKDISWHTVHTRFNNTCCACGYVGGSKRSKKGYLIWNVASHNDHNKSNCNEDNLTCLCPSCHAKYSYNRHSKKKPQEQKQYFTIRQRNN